jgi:pSer/pThr/pTyr-binding forkhead associated (FHA) protein
LYALIAAVVAAAGGGTLFVALRKSKAGEMPCPKCGKVMMADWPRCMFCKTPRGAMQSQAQSQSMKAAIQFVSGPLSGQTVELDGEVTTIGSAPGVSVTLADQGVSRKHAGIRRVAEPSGMAFEVADLGSKNGVYVNGEKVARRKLALGDVIRIGASEMIFKN